MIRKSIGWGPMTQEGLGTTLKKLNSIASDVIGDFIQNVMSDIIQSTNSTVPIVAKLHCDSLLIIFLWYSKSKYYFTKGIAIVFTLAIFY